MKKIRKIRILDLWAVDMWSLTI